MLELSLDQSAEKPEVVVAGHICLDIIPEIRGEGGDLTRWISPGKLVGVGAATLATGGAVANTGLAMNRLGAKVELKGKIGDDGFGKMIQDLLEESEPGLSEGLIVAKGEISSYTVVISPVGMDRIFLHCSGANDTFSSRDMDVGVLADQGARLLHFGYPPLMKRMYEHQGAETVALFRAAHEAGLTVSLDMARPDPDSEAGRTDWLFILQRILPYVDVFLPSFEELLYMLDRPLFDKFVDQAEGEARFASADRPLLSRLADRLIDMGAAIVVIKLGEHGLYAKTTSDPDRMGRAGAAGPANRERWLNRELLVPCFKVRVAGTTGAGDCSIAGFLMGLLKGLSPEAALTAAAAVGACNVERLDAISGIPHWEQLQARIYSGWVRSESAIARNGFVWDESSQVYKGRLFDEEK